jgi:hypothetical protein
MTRCSPVELLPRSHKNCTEEIPVTVNGTDPFVDPITYVIKSAGSPIHCNDVAPPRYKVGGKWYGSYPVLKECHNPAMLPVDEVRIDPVKINNIGLGKSIYTKEQLEEFAQFQDSQGTRKAYLAETAEMAYTGRNEKGEWGLALSLASQGSLIDIVGASFFFFLLNCFWWNRSPYCLYFPLPPLRGQPTAKCHPRWQPISGQQSIVGWGDCWIQTQDCSFTIWCRYQ